MSILTNNSKKSLNCIRNIQCLIPKIQKFIIKHHLHAHSCVKSKIRYSTRIKLNAMKIYIIWYLMLLRTRRIFWLFERYKIVIIDILCEFIQYFVTINAFKKLDYNNYVNKYCKNPFSLLSLFSIKRLSVMIKLLLYVEIFFTVYLWNIFNFFIKKYTFMLQHIKKQCRHTLQSNLTSFLPTWCVANPTQIYLRTFVRRHPFAFYLLSHSPFINLFFNFYTT